MKIVLDTNVFIVGFLSLATGEDCAESRILKELLEKDKTLILSSELEEQIFRVILRVKDKDFAGLVRHILWSDYYIEFVEISGKKFPVQWKEIIPRKDLSIFLTAHFGNADFLVTNDIDFLQKAKKCKPAFLCLRPQEFVAH
ncbi:MAG: hypothetical protein AABX82_04355 [Nanoarchaeota archaeon]